MTHFSSRYDGCDSSQPTVEELRANVADAAPEHCNVVAAADLLCVNIPIIDRC